MITHDTLRTALMVADPYDGIDQLIRAELADGRPTNAIHDEIIPLVKLTRKSPGFTEDADEALLGALDALTGNCHPDCQYTSSISTTPSKSHVSANGVGGTTYHTPASPSAGDRM